MPGSPGMRGLGGAAGEELVRSGELSPVRLGEKRSRPGDRGRDTNPENSASGLLGATAEEVSERGPTAGDGQNATGTIEAGAGAGQSDSKRPRVE